MFRRNLSLGDWLFYERQEDSKVTEKSKVSELGVWGKS